MFIEKIQGSSEIIEHFPLASIFYHSHRLEKTHESTANTCLRFWLVDCEPTEGEEMVLVKNCK